MASNGLSFNKAAILGVGLIGASFALAAREKGICKAIHGFGRNEANLKRAKERYIIDDYSLDATKACEGADLILLAAPVGAFKDIISRIKNSMKPGAIVTDTGSVKGRLVLDLDAMMPDGVNYVGSHPIAGSDKSGIDEARSDLFNNARCIITPTAKSGESAMRAVSSIWNAFGSKVEFMDPFKHDEIYAAVSHLPHIVAYTLVNAVDEINSDCIEYAGQGFKDTTRIAMSSPELWRDIAMLNRENLSRMIAIFKSRLGVIKDQIDAGDASGLERELAKAKKLRERLNT